MNAQSIKKAFEDRQSAVHALRELADEAEGRDMSAEEEQTFERQNAEIDRLDEVIKTGLRQIEREEEAAEARAQFSRTSSDF